MDRSGHGSGQKRRGAGEEEGMSGRGGFMRRRSDDERVHDVRNVYLGLNAEGKRNSGFVAQNRVVGPPTGSTLPTAGTTGLTTEVAKLKEQNDNLRAQMAALKRNEVQNQRDAERRIEQWRLQNANLAKELTRQQAAADTLRNKLQDCEIQKSQLLHDYVKQRDTCQIVTDELQESKRQHVQLMLERDGARRAATYHSEKVTSQQALLRELHNQCSRSLSLIKDESDN